MKKYNKYKMIIECTLRNIIDKVYVYIHQNKNDIFLYYSLTFDRFDSNKELSLKEFLSILDNKEKIVSYKIIESNVPNKTIKEIRNKVLIQEI